jgi:DNA-binding beta-propeller fold protein YncE
MRRALPLLGLLLAAGCGSATVAELPPAAEPGFAPRLALPPAGRVVRVGHGPEGIVADEGTGLAAVALRRPDRLVLLAVRTGRVRRRVPLPGAARHLALARPGGPVIVPAESANRVLSVALPSGRVSSDVRTPAAPHDAAAAAGRTLVGAEGGDVLQAVAGRRVAASVRVADQPGGVVALHGGRRVAVVSVRARLLELFDARTLRRLGSAPLGVGPTHVASDGRDRLWVTDTQGEALLVVRGFAPPSVVRRTGLPGRPYGLAVDRRRRRLWVTLTARNELVELEADDRPRVLRRYATVRAPNAVAVDPASGRVLVTGRADGVVQIVEPGRSRALPTPR